MNGCKSGIKEVDKMSAFQVTEVNNRECCVLVSTDMCGFNSFYGLASHNSSMASLLWIRR
jgi:hypothetical protein